MSASSFLRQVAELFLRQEASGVGSRFSEFCLIVKLFMEKCDTPMETGQQVRVVCALPANELELHMDLQESWS